VLARWDLEMLISSPIHSLLWACHMISLTLRPSNAALLVAGVAILIWLAL
jgi:hypothetical protein